MLYPKNKSVKLNNSLFENPTSEYRGTPFWSWNCKLSKEIIEKQIEYLKQMGFGGFHMHSRTGMDTEYLGDEFMVLIKTCVKKAENENMLAWLYDEDRWPSGFAGGLVTKEHKYRARKLLFTPIKRNASLDKNQAIEKGGEYFLACYNVMLSPQGELESYKRINAEDACCGDKWYAYVVTENENPWYNNQTYVDTLSKEAIDKFIDITYEAYENAVGDKFGNIVPAIFTDEPQFSKKTTLNFATDKTDIYLPWTPDITQSYLKEYNLDILDTLPELVWELTNNQISKSRYLYHDHIAERFVRAFADNCGGWCAKHNLMLTGHLFEEPTLKCQTAALGEAMRSYRSFQLPGIDILCNDIELTTAKQAQSACHQYGRAGVLSELYGVTNWDFDFRGHKFQGDWQAALGVTVRVPHLSLVSLAGEAKRDYPASINYQSPWYKEYSYVENHFARINTALTRGKPVVKVGVIHPIESYWLHWGPNESTNLIRQQLDDNFKNVTQWLLFGQIDFDFIAESLLPELCPVASSPLNVGEMNYSTIIVPGCETLRQSTLERLEQFQNNGGNLVFIGECPKYVDAEESDRVLDIYNKAKKINFSNAAVLSALQNEKVVDIRNADGTLTNNLIYNMRQDNECKWLFIANGKEVVFFDVPRKQDIIIRITGEYTPFLYDTMTGNISEIDYTNEHGMTVIKTTLEFHDSLLLKLDGKRSGKRAVGTSSRIKTGEISFKNLVEYKLSEPNVLLLDMAQYSFDGEDFSETEEILRIDNKFRDKLGYPGRQSKVVQPWTIKPEKPEHYLTLKFEIISEIELKSPILAIEDAKDLELSFNGEKVAPMVIGYYVDESIEKVKLPPLKQGKNILVVKIPFGERRNVEWCYLLGDFNVKVEGCVKTIVEKTNKIAFSSITTQGLPFYGGNITYVLDVETNDCSFDIKATRYRGALIKVSVDGEDVGCIVYAPYKLTVENIKKGKHKIELTLFGNRHNTFAALHYTALSNRWYGPNRWRSVGDDWCYEYLLKDTGILSSPVIEFFE